LNILESLKHIFGGGKTEGGEAPLSAATAFERFREVLRCNNSALELIADLGEKLSGDYIFDRQYIYNTMEDLKKAVLQSVHALNALCNNKYQILYSTYDRLTTRLDTVMENREDRDGVPVINIADTSRSHYIILGGKNAHLSQMLHELRLKIPEGFILTTRAYHDLIDHNGLREALNAFETAMEAPECTVEALEPLRHSLEQGILNAQPPDGLLSAIADQLKAIKGIFGEDLRLAIRSSAQEEDMNFSFAGQFRTILNVSPAPTAVFKAYLQVVASLFSPKALRYRLRVFPGEGHMSIAVGCYRMVESSASGVIYTVDPADPAGDAMIIVSTWGQGEAIVEGRAPVDTFRVQKKPPYTLLTQSIARKNTGLYPKQEGELGELDIPSELQDQPSLTPSQLERLAAYAMQIEIYYKRPQDIEWAIDHNGDIYILQARHLVIPATAGPKGSLADALKKYELIVSDSGSVAQQGIGAGHVHIVNTISDLNEFPEGAVLVSKRDSSNFIRVMHKTAAIVTEIGTPVSHMATLCREFQVPCLVNVTDILSKVSDGMEITVDAEDRRIYKGRVAELLAFKTATDLNISATKEFRLLKRLLDNVSSLKLVDPLMDEFTPEACETYHDLLRFIHEKAVAQMVEMGKDERRLLKDYRAVPLDLPIPTGILLIDLGGGIDPKAAGDRITFASVTSEPLKAILEGMLFPGVWHTRAADVSFGDLITSIVNVPTDALAGQYSGHNIAIISKDYLNLSLRFGYHFNIIDAYCSDMTRDNHIYFRFLGGATDITKRSRRARMIAIILEAFGFNVASKGDIVTGRSGNMPKSEIIRTLNILGRLVGFTRQLDVQMDSDAQVDRYVDAFLMGDYEIIGRH